MTNDVKTSQPLDDFWLELNKFLNSHHPLILIVILGILRASIALIAYSPADGADATDYYLQAAYLAGRNIPPDLAAYSPLFPMVITLFHYGLGNFDLILLMQFCMSVAHGLLFFIALRQYNAIWAFLIALVIIADMQVATVFNFAATEPLYLFLLASAMMLLLTQVRKREFKYFHWADSILALCIVALEMTRTVGTLIFVPIIGCFFFGSRNIWRTLILLGSYLLLSFLLTTIYELAFFQEENTTQPARENSLMLSRPLFTYELLSEDNGIASAELDIFANNCPLDNANDRNLCLQEQYGSRRAFSQGIRNSYMEMISSRPLDYALLLFTQFTDYLQLSGQQLRGGQSPADAQCANPEIRAERNTEFYLDENWILPDVEATVASEVRDILTDFTLQMCPPMASNETVRRLVDIVAERYRSISRPNPYLWATILTVLVVVLSDGRKLWFPIFASAGLLAYHASISALIFNVQPRYVVVTNPFKIIIVVSTVFLGIVALRKIAGRIRNRTK